MANGQWRFNSESGREKQAVKSFRAFRSIMRKRKLGEHTPQAKAWATRTGTSRISSVNFNVPRRTSFSL